MPCAEDPSGWVGSKMKREIPQDFLREIPFLCGGWWWGVGCGGIDNTGKSFGFVTASLS